MAGIYIHIPFCKQACHYCNFHFSTNLKNRTEMVKAICTELIKRQDYLANLPIESIYFGGGTPSILENSEVKSLLDVIHKTFSIKNPEVTLEANPEDMDTPLLDGFLESGINRLSIGIQTFNNGRLRFLNRSHNAAQVRRAIKLARVSGFKNISTDLIFAIPPEHDSTIRFKNDLNQLLEYAPEHISIYNLALEKKTVFGKWYSENLLRPVREGSSAEQYELAIKLLTRAGFYHYEVANFAQADKISQHNSSYWKNINYLGVGPGAHSFDGRSRTINVSNNAQYLRGIKTASYAVFREELSPIQKFNEYILTRTRTKWGIDLDYIQQTWGFDLSKRHKHVLSALISEGKASLRSKIFCLNSKGFSIADEVALRLFLEE